MPSKFPYLPLYTGDWLKDPSLSKCSPLTRGVWIDALAAMHESNRSGTLTGTPDQLARVLRCSEADVMAAARELSATGAAIVRESNGLVTLINRRMQREFKSRVSMRKRVNRHRQKEDCNACETPMKRAGNAPYFNVNVNKNSSSNSTSAPGPDPPGIAAAADLRSELEACGITGEGLRKALTVQGLYPIHVAVEAKKLGKRKDIRNPAGLLVKTLTDEYRPPPLIKPADLELVSKDHRILRINGFDVGKRVVRPHTSETTGKVGVAWHELTEKGQEIRGAPAEALKPEVIELARKT